MARHGTALRYEIFQCPLFNSDPHPGNIIVMPDARLGLIDYGQCKAFTDKRTQRYIAGEIVCTCVLHLLSESICKESDCRDPAARNRRCRCTA